VDVEFKDWLLSQIKQRGLSPAAFARKAGLSKQAIYNYLDGRLPDTDAIARLSSALRISPEEVSRAIYAIKSDDGWADNMNYKISQLTGSRREMAERLLDTLLDEQEREIRQKTVTNPSKL